MTLPIYFFCCVSLYTATVVKVFMHVYNMFAGHERALQLLVREFLRVQHVGPPQPAPVRARGFGGGRPVPQDPLRGRVPLHRQTLPPPQPLRSHGGHRHQRVSVNTGLCQTVWSILAIIFFFVCLCFSLSSLFHLLILFM